MNKKELDNFLKIIKELDRLMNKTYKERLAQKEQADIRIINLFDKQCETLRKSLEALINYVDDNLDTNNLTITLTESGKIVDEFKDVSLFDFWCWNFYLSDETIKIAKNYKKCIINEKENIDLSTKTALYNYIEKENKFCK